MKRNKYLLLALVQLQVCTAFAQNLPSLFTGRNINATFSILAYDEKAKEWGIAVATNNIYVGNSTVYIQPGLGAFSVIAETNPKYAREGFKKLKAGKSIKKAIEEVKQQDKMAHYRQVSGIDAQGNVFAFTGKALKYWKGVSAHLVGKKHVVMGNQLDKKVLSQMSATFMNSKGTLAQRLVASLAAGQKAGGQISGKQSAAVVVKGLNNRWYNQIDLRVDHSKTPIQDLQTLLNYHYGRIMLNQARYANRKGRKELATQKLKKAERLLDGWTGMYARVAQVHIVMNNEDKAVQWIQKGLKENPQWAVNLSSFYCLRKHPKMKGLIKPKKFTFKDWEHALSMYSNLGRESDLIKLAQKLLKEGKTSSYINYLLGRAYYFEKDQKQALKYLTKALEMDKDNVEAKQWLAKVKK